MSCLYEENLNSEGTFVSSTFKVEETKVCSEFGFIAHLFYILNYTSVTKWKAGAPISQGENEKGNQIH